MLRNSFVRALKILREEGPLSLGKRSTVFLRLMARCLYRRQSVYLYRHSLLERRRADFLPRLDNYEVHFVESPADAERLAARGLEDLRVRLLTSPRALSCGAIAFCVYVDARLVHVGWVAIDEAGKRHVDPIPFRVDFANGEACTGGTYTVPDFRGKGLMAYGYYERLEYLRQRGFHYSRNSVDVHNTASHKAHAKFSPEIWGVGRFIRILFWKSWKESPFEDGPFVGMPPSIASLRNP